MSKNWMDNRTFGKALRRAARAATEAADAQADLTDAFTERYGLTYSDVDADELIDPLDYGNGGVPTVKQADRIMAASGNPLIR